MSPRTKAILAGVVLLGALGSLWLTVRPPGPRIDLAVYTSLGQVLAQEAAKLAQNQGPIVVVVPDFYLRSGTPWHEQWKAFAAELKKHRALTLVPDVVPADTFQELLRRHAGVRVVVFMARLPGWDWLKAAGELPKIIAVDNGDVPTKAFYEPYFKDELVAAIIMPQRTAGATPNGDFGKYYRLLTPQNYESLP